MNRIFLLTLALIFIISTPLVFADDFTEKKDWQKNNALYLIEIDPLQPVVGDYTNVSCVSRTNDAVRMISELIIISVLNEREFASGNSTSIVTFNTDKLIRVTCMATMVANPNIKELHSTLEFHPVDSKNTIDSGDKVTEDVVFGLPVIKIPSSPVVSDENSTNDNSQKKSNNGGCNDCTPPTLGYDGTGVKKVDNGVCINDSCMDGGYFHTEYPMQSTLLFFPNTISLKYYENGSPTNIVMAQLGLGVPEIGSPLGESEVIIEVWLNYFKNDIYNPTIKQIIVTDPDDILSWYNADIQLVQCMIQDNTDNNCLEFNFKFAYAQPPVSTILMSNAMDTKRNVMNSYFNDGLNVLHSTIYAPKVIIPTLEEPQKECHYKTIQKRNNPCQFLSLIEFEKNRALEYLDQFK